MNNIYLIGMMGSGKTTVGELLAAQMGMRMVDLDAAVVADAQRTIPEIFAERGEAYFRELESNVLFDLHRLDNLVVATGGGTPLREQNRHLMKHSGTTVYLERDVEQIIQTIDAESRPLLKANPENVRRIFRERAGVYERAADITVLNDRTPAEVAREVCSAVTAFVQGLP